MNLKINLCVQVIFVILVVTFEKVSCYNDSYSREKRSVAQTGNSAVLISGLLYESYSADEIRAKMKVTLRELSHIESYAGHFTFNSPSKHFGLLFCWYFPAKVDPEKAPVILYLEGALHKDMFFGIFEQNGPITITSDGKWAERSTSWNRKHHVIYMDSLLHTGYSHGNKHEYQSENMAAYLAKALHDFFEVFTSLQGREFFVVGSYNAGKLAVALGNHIDHENSARMVLNGKINLKGVAIVNGLIEPLNQLNFGAYLYEIGLIDDKGKNQFLAHEAQIHNFMRYPTRAYHSLENLIIGKSSLFNNLTKYAHPFNILRDEPMPVNTHISNWIQSIETGYDLHTGGDRYKQLDLLSLDYLSKEMTRTSGLRQLEKFLQNSQKYRVLIYTGNFDILCSYPSVHNLLLRTNWPGRNEFRNADRILWHDRNGALAGYKIKARNLTEVLVRNAGHFISIDQPQRTLELLESFTDGSL